MAKYKLTWKDLSWNDFKIYLFALFKAFLPKKKIGNLDELETFIQTKSAWVSQVTLYGYLKTRMGTRYVLHFENEKFMESEKAKEIFFKILDDETSNKMPLDLIEETKKNFNERFQKIKWDNYYNDLPFNPSALTLFKWAPIADELKTLDRKIVLNSMILKWDIVKKEFQERINF
jgi:hypothetical protein